MLDKFLETLYNKVFVNIVVEGGRTALYVERCSAKAPYKVLHSAHAMFETISVSAKMIEFIESYTRETPYFYVSILDNSLAQGAIPSCDKNRFSYYHDLSTSEYRCVSNQWSYFTSKSDIQTLERKYQSAGIDFVFSPFTVLSTFFKDKIDSDIAMYVLIEIASISIMVFENSELHFAEFLDMHHMHEIDGLSSGDLDDDMELDLGVGINLEDIDVDGDEMELIDDFGDIEDLDSIEDMDEFTEHKEEVELFKSTSEYNDAANEGDFNEDYQRFRLIQSTLSSYYKDVRFESCFIEKVYMADNVGVSSELKRFLEEEMFLSVYIRQIDMAVEVCKLAKMELEKC